MSKLTAIGVVGLMLAGFASSAVAADLALAIPAGGRIGIIDMVRPDVTHFHVGATQVQSFLRTYPATWSTADVIDEPLMRSLIDAGLEPVSLPASDLLRHQRQSWFVSKPESQKLPRGCLEELERVITARRLAALIIVASGQNVSPDAAEGDRLEKLPEYVRGWGFSTSDEREGRKKPVVFNLTQLLLVTRTTDGVRLERRQWGGSHLYEWPNFVPAADMKAMKDTDIAKLRPVIAAVMQRQIAQFVTSLRH